jgi:hypothetical protein
MFPEDRVGSSSFAFSYGAQGCYLWATRRYANDNFCTHTDIAKIVPHGRIVLTCADEVSSLLPVQPAAVRIHCAI